jgi:hypothetical protein
MSGVTRAAFCCAVVQVCFALWCRVSQCGLCSPENAAGKVRAGVFGHLRVYSPAEMWRVRLRTRTAHALSEVAGAIGGGAFGDYT